MVSALNDEQGSAVDWWFAYKHPYDIAPLGSSKDPGPKSTGYEYLYYDAAPGQRLGVSGGSLDQAKGALYATLAGLFGPDPGAAPPGQGWILYNDEIPGRKDNDDLKGHTKGVLGFNVEDGSALWLLHSTPRYPLPGNAGFPADEKQYGQTYLCITLKDLATAEQLASQMIDQQEPQVYGAHTPPSLDLKSPLYQLAQGTGEPPVKEPGILSFTSRGGKAFRSIAKSRHWGEDFWIDLVGPTLGVDLNIETWRRGKLPGTADSDKCDTVEDIQYVNLSPLGVNYEWHYTKDHAKWAVSRESYWVCVGDINRQVSQEKRGGGAIAFEEQALWEDLSKIDKSAP